MTDAAIGARPAAKAGGKFYLWMALACLAIALVGFLPTYFLPLARGAFVAPPIVHIHGAVFYAWTLYFVAQTWFVASGRTPAHREWGLLGVALATAMVFMIFATMVAMMQYRARFGFEEQALVFGWVQASGALFFGATIALAIMNVRKPEAHKRLMLLATISLLGAPIARWFAVLLGAPPADPSIPPIVMAPPVEVTVLPSLVGDLLLLGAIVFDWRARGRPHAVYLWGGAALVLVQVTIPLIAHSAAWQEAARWFFNLGG